jgi:hypothetical protein
MSVKPNNPFYIKRYVKYINLVREDKDGEDHHILPKCLFPEYSDLKVYPENKKKLSHKAHYIAHLILWKALGGKMAHAFQMMTVGRNIKVKNSNLYNKLKMELRDLRSRKMSESNPYTQPKIKDKIIKKYGGIGNSSDVIFSKQKQTMLEKFGTDNYFKLPEFISGISERNKKAWEDPCAKAKRIENMKIGLMNRPILTCPHCGQESKSNSNMKRYHYDNCKSKVR